MHDVLTCAVTLVFVQVFLYILFVTCVFCAVHFVIVNVYL